MKIFDMLRTSALVALPMLSVMTACGTDLQPGSQLVGQRCYANSDCADGLVCGQARVCVPAAVAPPVVNPDMSGDMTIDPDQRPDPDMVFPDMPPPPDMDPDFPPDSGFECADSGVSQYCIDDVTVGYCEFGFEGAFRCERGQVCRSGECVFEDQECVIGGRDDFCISEQARQVCVLDDTGSTFYDVEFCEDDTFCFEGFCLRGEPECLPGGFDDYCLSERSRQYCRVEDGEAFYDVERCGRDEFCVNGACIGEDSECFPGDNFCLDDRTAQVCVPDGDIYRYDVQRCDPGEICEFGECFPDNQMECFIGEQYCVTDTVYEICLPNDRGDTEFVQFDCPPNAFCQDGACVEQCTDRDGDGAFSNCEPFDCDDFDFSVSPFLPETCGDNIDNNCDFRVDEGCGMGGCCTGANACAGNTFCQDCACVAYDPFLCTSDGQPCSNIDTFDNSYYCVDLTGSGQGTCVGLCDYGFPNPSATCNDPNNQACVFVDPNGGTGICFDECTTSSDCQAGDEKGCFRYDLDNSMNSGVCVPKPANTVPVGSPCDPNNFFGCEGSAVCVDIGQGPTCVESCRPFAYSGNGTDCPMGSFCTPFGDAFGVCAPDGGGSEFDACNAQGTTCSEDGVACYPSPVGGNRCRRTCRLSQGNSDCSPMQRCRDVNQGQSEVGICAAR